MKKAILIILALVLLIVGYSYIWGGRPYFEKFNEVSSDYKIVAKLLLNSYNQLVPYDSYPQNTCVVVDINGENLKCEDYILPLTDAEKKAVVTVDKKFNYFLVEKNAVFFRVDETGYYGLVYSKHPLAALYKAELPQDGREYHRINSHWYEWGVWGL